MTTISIIIPIYNVESYLEDCLDSILAQTFTDFELILVNDGSHDGSGLICDKYADRDKRILVVHKENSGVSSARNVGLHVAKGEFIAFVDPDDTIEPNMYEIMYNEAIIHNLELVICRIRTKNYFNGNESVSSIFEDKRGVLTNQDIKDFLIPSILSNKTLSLASSVNKLYSSEIFSNVKFDENKNHSEDVQLNFKILPNLNRILYVDKPLYNYFIRRKDSLTQIFNSNLYQYITANREMHINMCKRYNLQSYIDRVRRHFAGVTIMFIQSLVDSNLEFGKKSLIISQIVNDKEFYKDVKCYKAPSIFIRLLILSTLTKNVPLILKLLTLKQNLKALSYRK